MFWNLSYKIPLRSSDSPTQPSAPSRNWIPLVAQHVGMMQAGWELPALHTAPIRYRWLCSAAQKWDKMDCCGDSPLSGTQGTSRATIHWNAWSSGNYLPSHEQLFQRAQYSADPSPREWRFHKIKKLQFQEPFLCILQAEPSQRAEMRPAVIISCFHSCFWCPECLLSPSRKQTKLTKFLWNSQILSSDRHLNQLLRTSR